MNGMYGDPNSWDRFDLNIDDIDPEQLSREFLLRNNSGNEDGALRQLGSRQNSGLSLEDPSGDFLANMSSDFGFTSNAAPAAAAYPPEVMSQQQVGEQLQQQQFRQQQQQLQQQQLQQQQQQPMRMDLDTASLRQSIEVAQQQQQASSQTAAPKKQSSAGAVPPTPGPTDDALILKGRNIQDLMVDSVNFICGCSGFLPLQNELFLEVVREHFTERLKDPEFYELCERRYPVRDEVQPIIEKARQHSRIQDVRIWTVVGKHRLRESNWLELDFEDVTNNFVRRRERLESPLRSVLTKLYTNSTSSKTTRYPTPRSPNAPIQTVSSVHANLPQQLQQLQQQQQQLQQQLQQQQLQQQRQQSYGSLPAQVIPPQMQSRQPSYGGIPQQQSAVMPPQVRQASYGSPQVGPLPQQQSRQSSYGSAPMAPQQPSRQSSYGSSSPMPPQQPSRQGSYGSQQVTMPTQSRQASYGSTGQQSMVPMQQQQQHHHVQQPRQRSHGEMMMGSDVGMMSNEMGMSGQFEPMPIFTTPVLPETDRSWELKGEPGGLILYEDAVTTELMGKLNQRRTYVASLFSVVNEQTEDQANSCLARKVAKQWLDERSKSRWVCWIDASDPMTITDSYRKHVQSLRANDVFEQQPRKRGRLDPASAANDFFQEFNARFSSQFECLIVYVNVTHPDVFSEGFLPSNWLHDMHCQSTIRGILINTPHPVYEGNMGPPFGNNVVQHSIEWIPHWSETEKRYWWDRLPQSNLPPLLDDVEEPEDIEKKLSMDGRAVALVDLGRERADHAGDIANQFARRWEMSENSDRFSIWLKADSEIALRESYRLAIRRVTHSAPQNPLGNPVDLSVRVIGDELMSILMKVRELSPTKQWIMVFADANNNYVPFHEKFFSGSSNWWNSKGRFVITTTSNDIEVEVMTDGLAYRKKVATIQCR